MNFRDKNVYIFDLDGCLYSGDDLYPGADELLKSIVSADKKIVVLSNNSNQTAESVGLKLMKMGLPAEMMTILVATDLIGKYLFEKYGTLTLKCVGSSELQKSLEACGHNVVELESETGCDYLVIGRDLAFSYNKLQQCCREIRHGAKLAAANLDLNHPGSNGVNVPETGALVAAIQAASEVYEIECCGKPSGFAYEYILASGDYGTDECVMIGDNLHTDILGAQQMGIDSVWISHGRLLLDKIPMRPSMIVDSVNDLVNIFTL